MIPALVHSSLFFSARTSRGRTHRRGAFSGPAHPTVLGGQCFTIKADWVSPRPHLRKKSNVCACANVVMTKSRAFRLLELSCLTRITNTPQVTKSRGFGSEYLFYYSSKRKVNQLDNRT